MVLPTPRIYELNWNAIMGTDGWTELGIVCRHCNWEVMFIGMRRLISPHSINNAKAHEMVYSL